MYSTLSPSWEKHVLLALVSATFATAAPTTSSAQSFQGLGFLPGTNNSSAQGVNADGTVVVGVGQNQAFRWTTATGMAGLGFLAGDNVSVATGVNADGAVVVGHSTDATSGIQQAFRWTVAAGMSLQVSPATGIASSGSQGGPFSPSSFKYTRERQAATFNARSPAFRRGSLPRQLQAL